MSEQRVVVIGAGVGGLAAAIDLARAGRAVTVVERGDAPGGKMRRVAVAGLGVDAGPTVFTMRWVFDGLLGDAGTRLEDHLELHTPERLARHGWEDGSRLDLWADRERSAAPFLPSDSHGHAWMEEGGERPRGLRGRRSGAARTRSR